MKRDYSVVYLENQQAGYAPGDDAAHRAAAPLADRADAPTVAALLDALTLLERIGGQFHITALRIQDENGNYETHGLGFRYDTADAKGKPVSKPREVAGVPITEAGESPVELPVGEDVEDEGWPTAEQVEAAQKLIAEHPDAETGDRTEGPGGILVLTLDNQEWVVDLEGNVSEVEPEDVSEPVVDPDGGQELQPEKEPALSE